MKCPRCKSEDIDTQILTNTNVQTKTKGFGWCRALIGFCIAWPLVFCGFCGMGKGKTKVITTNKTVHICKNCGKTF